MARGDNLQDPAHQRRAGQARAADRAEMARIGALGAATTLQRYGPACLMKHLAAWRRGQAPTGYEAPVLAALAAFGLVAGQDYECHLDVTVPDAAGQAHTYELDFVFPGLLDVEADSPWHDAAARAAQDQDRDRNLTRAGWTICRLPRRTLADPASVRGVLAHFFARTGGLPE